jgi:hypothetical protein
MEIEALKRGIQDAEVAAEALKRAGALGVDLDRRRQGNREALRALRKHADAAAGFAPGSGAPRPPKHAFVFCPGGVIARMPRDDARAFVERDQARVEAAVAENDRAKKQALRRLGETGGVPETVGKGLLDAFVNLEDTTSARARKERMERVEEEE